MFRLSLAIAVTIVIGAPADAAQQPSAAGPYKILKTAKVGGDGG